MLEKSSALPYGLLLCNPSAIVPNCKHPTQTSHKMSVLLAGLTFLLYLTHPVISITKLSREKQRVDLFAFLFEQHTLLFSLLGFCIIKSSASMLYHWLIFSLMFLQWKSKSIWLGSGEDQSPCKGLNLKMFLSQCFLPNKADILLKVATW